VGGQTDLPGTLAEELCAALQGVRRPPGAVRHIVPGGSGRRDGSSWADAAHLSDLPALVAASAPGDEVWIRGDLGPYAVDAPITLRAGGAPGAPVVVRGVDAAGTPAATPLLAGSRAAPYDPAGTQGKEVFRLLGGADHLHFDNIDFRDQGNGCFRIGADVADLTITRSTATNVRRFVEDYVSGDAKTASVAGLVVRDVRVLGFSKGAIRLRYNSRDVLLEDVTGDSQYQSGEAIAFGVYVDGSVHRVTHRRVTMRNSLWADPDGYWNGDGFVAENGTSELVYEDTLAAGNADGGYDLKARGVLLVRAAADDNKRNYRFWGDAVELRDSSGTAPRSRGGTGTQTQLWSGGKAGGTVRVVGSRFEDDDPRTIVFEVDGQARVRVEGGTVRSAPDARRSRVAGGARFEQYP